MFGLKWGFTSPPLRLMLYAFAGWAIGLVIHALHAYEVFDFLSPKWERRMVERRLGRKLNCNRARGVSLACSQRADRVYALQVSCDDSPSHWDEGQGMDVQVDGELIRSEREKRAWSQEHLAGAAGIGARTIQRIEATGIASYESVRAISAALDIPVGELRADGSRPPETTDQPSASSQTGHALTARLRLTARWIGAAVALAMLAGMGGFLLLHDYQKVRVLRTFEQWVTAEPSLGAANRPDGR